MSQAAPRQKRAFEVAVDAAVCDGCGICIFFCKPVVFRLSEALSRRGVYPAEPINAPGCTGCGLCEPACPQLAITVVALTGKVTP